jgi:hypothetical protein
MLACKEMTPLYGDTYGHRKGLSQESAWQNYFLSQVVWDYVIPIFILILMSS